MKTKLIFTLLFTFFASVSLLSQGGEEEMRLLFNKKDDSKKKELVNGGYGGIVIGYTQIDSKDAMTIGARFAWIANHHFALGIAGRGFFNNFGGINYYDDQPKIPEYYLAGGYGGLLLEPIIVPMSPVNVSFPIIIGAGGVASSSLYWDNYYYYNDYYSSTAFFLAEAGVDIQFNITKFFRVAVGGGYRYTSDISLYHSYYDDDNVLQREPVSKDALRGFNIDLSLKFGWF